jgi:23S rRNA (guanosine2251-2'-O)-methyltransferase
MSRFVYGVNPVLEALKAHPKDVVRVLVERGHEGRKSRGADRVGQAAADAGVRVEDVPQGDLAHRSRSGAHQGVGAELTQFRYAELEDVLSAIEGTALLLVLDGVTDPQNLGALARNAHALGAHGIVVPKDRAAGITPAAFKAAAGALEHCPVARVTNLSRALDLMKEQGIWTVALAEDGEKEIGEVDLTVPTALVLGSEGSGVRPLVRKTCDHAARIPMAGQVGSLNVAAAGAVALYEVLRQRRLPGTPAH